MYIPIFFPSILRKGEVCIHMADDSTAPLCPVCRSIFVRPRLYPCGHSVCSHCMQQSDDYTTARFIHSMRIYRCPVCRDETLSPWFRRPKNVALRQICEKHKDYMSRLVEVGPEKHVHEDAMTMKTDLSKLAFSQQQTIAQELYEYLIPLLHTAAMEGRSFIVISEEKTVKRVQRVADTFGDLLFRRHNVYKVIVTSTDISVYFLNSTTSHRAERMNEIWTDPIAAAIEQMRARRRGSNSTSMSSSSSDELPPAPQRHNPHTWTPPVLDP